MKSSVATRLLSVLAAAGAPTAVLASPNPAPAPTPAPELVPADVLAARATTSYYSFVTTEIQKDEFSIGMGLQKADTNSYYWLYCVIDPFTVSGGFGGCGRDDLYTRCSGGTAYGIDGDSIRCDVDCVTHKIYEDLDVTTFTPFIGCGRGTSTMNLLRTSTGAGTGTGTGTGAGAGTETGTSAGDATTAVPTSTTDSNDAEETKTPSWGAVTRPRVGGVLIASLASVIVLPVLGML